MHYLCVILYMNSQFTKNGTQMTQMVMMNTDKIIPIAIGTHSHTVFRPRPPGKNYENRHFFMENIENQHILKFKKCRFRQNSVGSHFFAVFAPLRETVFGSVNVLSTFDNV